ncbi:hypothetical protein PF005_g27384 [Phytophthora fragariae]|uniref:Uncharacterized protein n=1 Tax=Phytophthora fragariae TaxID=53985 RepID=A0A6A3VP14_9STRA|nr:hypothetical protein PF003_g6386 [Phytophthora fragariae]KAE9170876.1 hypothetical protein PF005_g27384 [Phytophthora fragariae]KAE9178624.1 hypothetical protein PF002_g28027 [Phytophthora fragariae]
MGQRRGKYSDDELEAAVEAVLAGTSDRGARGFVVFPCPLSMLRKAWASFLSALPGCLTRTVMQLGFKFAALCGGRF